MLNMPRLILRLRRMAALALLLLGGLGGWASTPASAAPAPPFDLQHTAWSTLLQHHVQWIRDGHASAVDYRGLSRERDRLRDYLDALSALPREEFARWSVADRRAFLINAYNAFTVELVLTRYPDLRSIRELGGWFSTPWKLRFFPLLGATRSLDEVEHELLRGDPELNDPRIHFAVNCASLGCPALRPEAYRGDQLESQLDDQLQRFLSDRERNRIEDGSLQVSKLFDWYEDDFVAADSALKAPLGFLAQHADALTESASLRQRLRQGELSLQFTDYDWSLNGLAP